VRDGDVDMTWGQYTFEVNYFSDSRDGQYLGIYEGHIFWVW